MQYKLLRELPGIPAGKVFDENYEGSLSQEYVFDAFPAWFEPIDEHQKEDEPITSKKPSECIMEEVGKLFDLGLRNEQIKGDRINFIISILDEFDARINKLENK